MGNGEKTNKGGLLDYPGIQDYGNALLDSAAFGIAGYGFERQALSARLKELIIGKMADAAQNHVELQASVPAITNAIDFFERYREKLERRIESIQSDHDSAEYDRVAADAAPGLLHDLQCQYLFILADEVPQIYRKYKKKFSRAAEHHSFTSFEALEAHKNAWKERIRGYKRGHEDLFWNWVHGKWDDGIDEKFRAVTRNSAHEIPGYPSELSVPFEAAIEARMNIELIRTFVNQLGLWEKKGINIWNKEGFDNTKKGKFKEFIKSPFRSYDYQKGLYENKMKKPYEDKDQKDVLRTRSAPGTSRHHWCSDYDLYDLENEPFREGNPLYTIYVFLSTFARYWGLVHPYTEKREHGVRPPGIDWYRVRKAKTPGNVVLAPVFDPLGYNEERWHWSYWPIGQALLELCAEDLYIAHTKKAAFWGDKKKYTVPVKYWPDYVFNVKPMGPFPYKGPGKEQSYILLA